MDFSAFLKNHGLTRQQLIVWALIPFREDGFFDSYYDWRVTQAELDKAFTELGLEWRWQPVNKGCVRTTVQSVLASSNGQIPLVLNYCDGDEINGFPGLSAVKELEGKGLAFTGAAARFYEISTSKIWMKRLFEKAGVPTAPFAVVEDHGQDMSGLFHRLGAPLFVKPSVSAGAWGLTLKSVVHTGEELDEQVRRVKEGLHGFSFSESGIFVERFVNGPEYTVFLVGSAEFPERRRIYPPLERIFHRSLPEEERFVTYERNWDKYAEETPLMNGELIFEEKLADANLCDMLSELAWEAHCAVHGTGYSRVDIRVDEATGQPFVLEVNANCSLSSADDETSIGYILKFIRQPFSVLIGEILTDGLHRYFTKKTE